MNESTGTVIDRWMEVLVNNDNFDTKPSTASALYQALKQTKEYGRGYSRVVGCQIVFLPYSVACVDKGDRMTDGDRCVA